LPPDFALRTIIKPARDESAGLKTIPPQATMEPTGLNCTALIRPFVRMR
jgi:hypothetical protein